MKFIVDKKIFEVFDHPIIGMIMARNLNNHGLKSAIAMLLQEVEVCVRDEFSKLESPGQHSYLRAWRQAYKTFGSDPHQYRCSAESLVRRVLRGDSLPRINTLVDLYNYISLKYVIPVGGEDIDVIRGNLQLTFADGSEPFTRLNGIENESPTEGEVVYKDDEGVVCRRWNWREAERTKLTEHTKNAIIVLDALAPIGQATIKEALHELASLIKEYCGGEVIYEVRMAGE